MKVSELGGAQLDYWVAKTENHKTEIRDALCVVEINYWKAYQPSSDWSQGGPIIERERLITASVPNKPWLKWTVCCEGGAPTMQGDTLLIAAMRCFVASKFGKEVPDEL